ncbi:MAG: radical SAM protein [Bacilli bacterium]|nr:radical SAM protein [Bacilli bacterium]
MFFRKYKSILSPQNGMNIYRGCTHGCIYCDSRSKCYQINHDFADIEVKQDAPKQLDLELSMRRKPCMIGTGSMTDPYNHVEKDIEYTRKCLKVILKHHCGVAIQTKSDLILRDIDLINKINKDSKAVVEITLTTADDELCKRIEPNVCSTSKRVEILRKCKELGIPTVVWLCPFLPFINDNEENINKLMDICIENDVKGILFFGVGLTLREGNREYFYECLDKEFPGLKEKYIKQYGNKYEVSSDRNSELSKIIIDRCKKNNIMCDVTEIFKYLREYPNRFEQMSLFI